MPEPDQPGRELGDMYVLTTGVDATNGSQRARVFRNQGYPHCTSHLSVLVLRQVPGSSLTKRRRREN